MSARQLMESLFTSLKVGNYLVNTEKIQVVYGNLNDDIPVGTLWEVSSLDIGKNMNGWGIHLILVSERNGYYFTSDDIDARFKLATRGDIRNYALRSGS